MLQLWTLFTGPPTQSHLPATPAAVCLHQLFEAAAEKHAEAVCIRAESGALTYAQVRKALPASQNSIYRRTDAKII